MSLGDQSVHGLLDGLTDGPHGNDDIFRIRRAYIVEGLVAAAGDLLDFFHIVVNDFRNLVVEFIGGLTHLEEDIRILRGSADDRMFRIQRPVPEFLYGIHIDELCQVIIVQHFDLLNLVGGTEAVEEMQERHPALDGGKMSDSAQVHDFLYRIGGQHGKTGLTGCHNVGVVSENIQRVGGKASGTDMHNARKQLACDLIHVRDHEQQSLRCSVGCGEGACGQGTVEGSGCACF